MIYFIFFEIQKRYSKRRIGKIYKINSASDLVHFGFNVSYLIGVVFLIDLSPLYDNVTNGSDNPGKKKISKNNLEFCLILLNHFYP